MFLKKLFLNEVGDEENLFQNLTGLYFAYFIPRPLSFL